MMGRHSTDLSTAGAGRPLPLIDLSCSQRQSRLPDPQKKKKKKWREADRSSGTDITVVDTLSPIWEDSALARRR